MINLKYEAFIIFNQILKPNIKQIKESGRLMSFIGSCHTFIEM